MSLSAKLALAQLRENRKRTVLTLLGIILSVAMIAAVFGFAASGRKGLTDFFVSQGNWHVCYRGITMDEAATLAADPHFENMHTEENLDGSITLYARLLEPTADAWETRDAIAAEYGITDYIGDTNSELLALEGYVPDRYSTMIYSVAAVLFIVIIGTSVIVVSNAFRVSAGERTAQFGMLNSAGATARQIRAIVTHEGMLLSAIGIPIGIVLGLGIEAIGILIINRFLIDLNAINENRITMNFTAPWWVFVGSILLAFVTIYLSAYLPARKAARIPAIEAIRGSGEVKLKASKLRSARLVRKVFGVEGELASKSMKRSRRNYRATVIALSMSVILFLIGTTLGQSLMKSIRILMPNANTTAYVQVWSTAERGTADYTKTSPALAQELTDKFQAFDPTASVKLVGMNSGIVVSVTNDLDIGQTIDLRVYRTTTDDIWSDTSKQLDPTLASTGVASVVYVILDDAFYREMCKQAGAEYGANILMNAVVTTATGTQKLYAPLKPGIQQLSVIGTGINDPDELLAIGGELTDLPPALQSLTTPASVLVITPNREMDSAVWYTDAEDSAGFAKYAQEILDNDVPRPQTDTLSATATDIKASLAAQRSLANLIMLFIYGFIALLTLIGLTNVISTISTNIRLRRREFAILVSLGMTQRGIKRMLHYESLLCGIRSLVIGLMGGLAASRFVYNSIADIAILPYEFPAIPVAASVLAVLIITWATMRYAASRLGGGSLIEAIRTENA
jgi:putative ABC transport system permease protein